MPEYPRSPLRKVGTTINPRVPGDTLSCPIAPEYGIEWDESADTYIRTGSLAGVACGSSP